MLLFGSWEVSTKGKLYFQSDKACDHKINRRSCGPRNFSSPCGQVPRSILSTGKVGTNRDLLGSDGEFFGTDPIGLEAWLKKTGKTEAGEAFHVKLL